MDLNMTLSLFCVLLIVQPYFVLCMRLKIKGVKQTLCPTMSCKSIHYFFSIMSTFCASPTYHLTILGLKFNDIQCLSAPKLKCSNNY